LQLLRQTQFSVITCRKYHASRLPVIRNTWGRLADNLIFVSDFHDPDNNTVSTEYGNQVSML
jgi:hypothetical protein